MIPVTNSEKARAFEKARASLSSLYHDNIINYAEFQYFMSVANDNLQDKISYGLSKEAMFDRERLIKLECIKDSVRKALGYENLFDMGKHVFVIEHERYLKKIYKMIDAIQNKLKVNPEIRE